MGKFYELFNMDAAIGVKELGLIFMKVNHDYCYRVSRYKVLIVSLLIFLMSFFSIKRVVSGSFSVKLVVNGL